MYSHFVSRVVLKNFADKNQKIRVFDKQIHDFVTTNKLITDICGMELSEQVFSEVEKKWSKKIEQRIGDLLEKHTGDIVKIWIDGENHPALRRLLALHFVRSFFFMTKLQDVTQEEVNQLLALSPPELHDIITRQFVNQVVISTPQMWDDFYQKTKNYLDKFELELGEAHASENFIIGDIPILNDRKAVMDSEFFILPISPRYVIGVARKRRLWNLSKRATRKIKKIAKRESLRYWFCHPETR